MNDRIEKQILLRAPRSRVWRALADQGEFGDWFGVRLPAGKFTPGEKVSGHITIRGYEHVLMTVVVDRVEPERFLSFRWHPYAVDPNTDYSSEPMTLVAFTLADADGGTLLKVVESGFDGIPAARRDEAWRMNDAGWAGQIKNIERYVTKAA